MIERIFNEINSNNPRQNKCVCVADLNPADPVIWTSRPEIEVSKLIDRLV